MEALKNDPGSLERMLAMTPIGSRLNKKEGGGLKDWLDFSLLPSFDRVAKYFYFTVYGGSATAEGISFKVFAPTAPALREAKSTAPGK